MFPKRAAGVLLHPTSLPSPYEIGDLGPAVDLFLDWAAAAGFSIWQVLPLGPTGYGNSPYGAMSSFAGNPLLISPEELMRDGLLPREEYSLNAGREDHVDFRRAIAFKTEMLRRSWSHFTGHAPAAAKRDADAFNGDPAQGGWLDEWAFYQALKGRFDNSEWARWPEPLKRREQSALAAARAELSGEIAFHKYVQWLFSRQWQRVRQEAHRRGIAILGDLPIYVALDSADVWADADQFLLDDDRRPIAVAGVPPDYFSPTGQLWGNPLYRWDRMAENGYGWWIARLRANLRTADLLRLDHFRGFAAYWEVPASEPTAVNGHWSKGPGIDFFRAVRAALGDLPLIAEDLGLITEDVDELRMAIRLPGMRVLQFGFGDVDNIHLPHHYTPDTVVYTGTHDNDTTPSWYANLSSEEHELVRDYVGAQDEPVEMAMIRTAYNSVARMAIVPMQDALGLGAEARMNTPGRPEDNWTWRLRADQLDDGSAERLRRLAEISGRAAANK